MAVFARSFLIQGSWNYRTMIGAGFAFALLPVLRRVYGDDPDRLRQAVSRHLGPFNSHPYLSSIALGAVGALEEAGEDPRIIERFKTAIRGSLGALGDQAVWAGWRPVCVLFAIALLLVGVPWWLGLVVFLGVYNAGHIGLRVWGYRLGLRSERRVGERLRGTRLTSFSRGLGALGAFLVGLVLPLLVTGAQLDPLGDIVVGGVGALWSAAAVLAAGAGLVWGGRVRDPLSLFLLSLVLLGVVMQVLS